MTKSEYIVLLKINQTLLPMQQLLDEITKYSLVILDINQSIFDTNLMKCLELFEDNSACFILEFFYHNKPRTKHPVI